ncbi:hypothetical protein C8Q74DRAFT_1218982 [Fomes fomentarius]|nr:hypothetical protein C8Q74DRAFT_1218982 [Fomes fomentarius]
MVATHSTKTLSLCSPLHIVFHRVVRGQSCCPSAPPTPSPPPRKRREYATSSSALRGAVRAGLDNLVATATGVPNLTMQYTVKGFCDNIVVPFELALRNWPGEVPFDNLSDAKVSHLRDLLWRIKSGILFFGRATAAKICAAYEHSPAACPGEIFRAPVHHFQHRNVGSSTRGGTNGMARRVQRRFMRRTRIEYYLLSSQRTL